MTETPIHLPFHGIPLREECDRLGFTKYQDIVESMVASGSILDMPQFPKKKLMDCAKHLIFMLVSPSQDGQKLKLLKRIQLKVKKCMKN